MSNWRIANIPFPEVAKTSAKKLSDTVPGEDSAAMSVDQERALHKWVNDVRHWVQSGRAGSDDEVKAMLAAKGCPSPDDVVNAYHMTKDLQADDIATDEPQQSHDPAMDNLAPPQAEAPMGGAPGGEMGGMEGGPPPEMGGMPEGGGGPGMDMEMPPGEEMPMPGMPGAPEDFLEPDEGEEDHEQKMEDQDDYAVDPRLVRSALDEHIAATLGSYDDEKDEQADPQRSLGAEWAKEYMEAMRHEGAVKTGIGAEAHPPRPTVDWDLSKPMHWDLSPQAEKKMNKGLFRSPKPRPLSLSDWLPRYIWDNAADPRGYEGADFYNVVIMEAAIELSKAGFSLDQIQEALGPKYHLPTRPSRDPRARHLWETFKQLQNGQSPLGDWRENAPQVEAPPLTWSNTFSNNANPAKEYRGPNDENHDTSPYKDVDRNPLATEGFYPEWAGPGDEDPAAELTARGWTNKPLSEVSEQHRYVPVEPGYYDQNVWVDPNGPDAGGPEEGRYHGYFEDPHEALDHVRNLDRLYPKQTAFGVPDSGLPQIPQGFATVVVYTGNESQPWRQQMPLAAAQSYVADAKARGLDAEIEEGTQQSSQQFLNPGMRAAYNQVTGTITNSFVDTWGIPTIRLATDFGTFDVPAQDVTPVAPVAADAPVAPSAEVSQYLSEIDPAGSTLASVEARIANIKNAIDFCVEKISSVGLTEQMKLDKISLDCRIELAELSNARKSAVLDSGESYLASLPKYEIGKGAAAGGAGFGVRSTDGWLDQAHDQMTEEQNGFDGDAFVNEQAPLFVSELPQQMVGDGAVVAAAAAEKAYERVAHLGIDVDAFVNGFVAAVESHRRTRLAAVKTEMKKSASAEFNGPDEALFM